MTNRDQPGEWVRIACALVIFAGCSPALAQSGDASTSAPAEADESDATKENGEDAETSTQADDWWTPAKLDGPLVTDRPDFTECAVTVPRGHLQLEAGYTYSYDREHHVTNRTHTAPELLLRVGLIDDVELRIGWAGYSWVNQRTPGETQAGRPVMLEDWSQGGADQYIGVKWKLFDEEGLRPDFAIIPGMFVPTGGNGFSSGDVDPEIKLAWGYTLTDRLGLAGNLNFATPTEDGHRFFQTGASVSLAYALTDTVGAFAEYFGIYPNASGTDCAHTMNGGLTWQLTPNFQLDWRAGVGLNEEADDFFTGDGFSIRY